MRSIFFFFALLLLPLEIQAKEFERCGKPLPSEPITYSDDFTGTFTLEGMADLFEKHYASGRRLKGRAYYDSDLGSLVLPHSTGLIKISPRFIQNVTRHVEISLERRYADFVFFPDMGHSHLHLPESVYEEMKAIKPIGKMYENFFAYDGLQMLYHTAEKLAVREGKNFNGAFPQDPILLWRYFSRNPVGDNNDGENVKIFFHLSEPQKYNTVKDIPGHKEYSAGFDISASKEGCFPFESRGKKMYFDLSLDSLPCKNCE
jgi:hypothetical protein